jgi:hypothetical protein
MKKNNVFLLAVLLKGNGMLPLAYTVQHMFRAPCFDKRLEQWVLLKYWHRENYNFPGSLNYHFLEKQNIIVAFQSEIGSSFPRM